VVKNGIELESHDKFVKWRNRLKDAMARALIAARLERIRKEGFLGDCEFVGEGVYELRIHYGPGYRIYFVWVDGKMILLLCGGIKSDQNRDIIRAKQLAKEMKDGAEK